MDTLHSVVDSFQCVIKLEILTLLVFNQQSIIKS